VDFQLTKRHVARGARPDAEAYRKMHLFKGASELRATYQIRLLLYRAVQENKQLVINIPKECQIAADLRNLIKEYARNVEIERR
jgi:hypothetical protein